MRLRPCPEPLETVEDQIEPELELALVLLGLRLHVLLGVLDEVGILVGGISSQEVLGQIVEPSHIDRTACSPAERESQMWLSMAWYAWWVRSAEKPASRRHPSTASP